MCLNPKLIQKKGQYKEDNYRGSAGNYYEIEVYSKCGHCTQCINEKAGNWLIRNSYEASGHEKKCFITLTYEKNPIILVKKDFQEFMKRLRRHFDTENESKYIDILKEYGITMSKYKLRKEYNSDQKKRDLLEPFESAWERYENERTKIRYYGCGEYGSLHRRPHGHFIIYGWEDPAPVYIGINKRGNLIYKSDLIERTWGKGRTSHNKFETQEITYLSLYDTPKETMKEKYLVSRENLKAIERIVKANNLPISTLINVTKELREAEKKMNAEKAKYLELKEFNMWSTGLGWNQFEAEYIKANDYAFEEYFASAEGTKTIATPSPWLKKLANQYGDIRAAEEIFRREADISKTATVDEERNLNRLNYASRKKEEIQKHQERLTKNGGYIM